MSLIPTWRPRRQEPAAIVPSIVECDDITETEAMAESLEILCRHRFLSAVEAIDREMSAWTGQYRQATISGQHHVDALLEIRNLLVRALVKS